MAIVAACTTAQATPLEQAIKASYITKFAPFIEWPSTAFAEPASPFQICLAGRDEFGSTIDELARGETVRGRPMQVRRVADVGSLAGCQILFIGRGTSETVLAQVAGKPMLTVGDKASGAEPAMIRFVPQAGRIRFEIDNSAARAAHLAVSSKLLSLAATVVP